MTAIRTSQQNAFEGELTAEMGPNDLTVTVDGVGTLTTPCYLVIEMDNDAQREYIYFDGTFTGTTFVTTNIANRYLPGSGAGSNLTHPIGKKIRTYVGKQHHDDLHDRIDGITHASLGGLSADDHPQYSLADGSRAFTQPVGGESPSVATDLATKGYVDGQVAGGIPAGVIMAWGAVSAPGGYLLCNGAEVSRATYADLFAIIASIYGDGNGTTTFDLPDLRGRFPLGLAISGVGDTLGATGGTLTPTIDLEHAHGLGSHVHDIGHGHADTFTTASDAHTHAGPSHTHATSIDHDHGSVDTSVVGSHNHSFSDTSGSPSSTSGPFSSGGVTLAGSSTHTHFVSGTTGANSSHDHSVNLPNYNVSDVTSSASGTGQTDSDSHSHTVNGSVTAFAGNSQGSGGTSDTGLSDGFAVPNPAFLALEFIIKI